jgi:AcrR family transcriptional regulator
MATQRRGYDARRRRERAEEERRATRRRVLDAAARLFVAQGYTATTIADIAREAGVAVQSVYKAGQSKAELLHAVVDLAVAGDDEDIMIADRAAFAAIGDETDTRRQVQRFADLIASIQERSAPVQAAYRQAAAVDDSVAASLAASHRRRIETFTTARRSSSCFEISRAGMQRAIGAGFGQPSSKSCSSMLHDQYRGEALCADDEGSTSFQRQAYDLPGTASPPCSPPGSGHRPGDRQLLPTPPPPGVPALPQRGGRRLPRTELHVICDNYAAHKHAGVRAWLARAHLPGPRTPTTSSARSTARRLRLLQTTRVAVQRPERVDPVFEIGP